jgi:CRP/FNR family transcriptional regulator, cyclic AMP receptor protein
MHAETMDELLASHPFFAGLSADAIRLVAGCASNVHFAQGEYIFSQGEAASRFYVLRHGRVAMEIHSPERGPLVIDTMDEGEVLGWSWLIPPYQYFGDARAVTPVSAIALDGACLRGKCEADAELGYQLLKRVTTVMYKRLQSARVRLLDLYGPEPARALSPARPDQHDRHAAWTCHGYHAPFGMNHDLSTVRSRK